MIKKLILFLLCLCMLFTAGCSYANTHTREEPVPTLNIASSFSSDIAAQTYQALSSTFASRYGLQILDNSTLSGDAYTQKIINDFAAGNEPDVFYYPVDAAQTMIENGQVVSLEEIRRVYPQYATTLQAGILEQLADENGHNWCVPILGTYQALYCNVELFEIYGAPLPYTWTDLMTAIDIFQEYNIVPIAAGFRDNTQFWLDHLILSYGTFEHSAVPLDIDDVPHTWGQALVQLPRLNAMEAFPGNVTTLSHASAQTLFSSGRAAMILDSSDHLSLLGNEDTLIALSIPCQPPASAQKHLLVEYTSGLYISRKAWENSTLRDAAVQFVMYMSSQEAVYRLIEDGAGYPALSRERLTTISSQNPLTQSVLELALSSQLHTSISHRLNRKAWVSLNSSMVQLYQGYSDIGRVLDDLIKYNSNQP